MKADFVGQPVGKNFGELEGMQPERLAVKLEMKFLVSSAADGYKLSAEMLGDVETSPASQPAPVSS